MKKIKRRHNYWEVTNDGLNIYDQWAINTNGDDRKCIE